jgi:hypothetical protein
MDDSDTEDTDHKGKRRAKKKTEKFETKEEQKLISFLNQMDAADGKTYTQSTVLYDVYSCSSLTFCSFSPYSMKVVI